MAIALHQESPALKDHLYMLDGGFIFTSPRVAVASTARYNASIVLTSGKATVEISVAGHTDHCQAAAIRPGTKRSIGAEQGQFVALRINPMHPQFRCFGAIRSPGTMILDRKIFARFDTLLEAAYGGRLAPEDGPKLFEGITGAAVSCFPRQQPADARMERMLRFLSEHPDSMLAELSAAFDVSPDRMSHIFRKSVGIPLKSYLLFQKIYIVPLLQIKTGLPLTDVAKIAGFTDLQHLDKAFLEVSGISPSYILQSGKVKVFFWRTNRLPPFFNHPLLRQQQTAAASL